MGAYNAADGAGNELLKLGLLTDEPLTLTDPPPVELTVQSVELFPGLSTQLTVELEPDLRFSLASCVRETVFAWTVW